MTERVNSVAEVADTPLVQGISGSKSTAFAGVAGCQERVVWSASGGAHRARAHDQVKAERDDKTPRKISGRHCIVAPNQLQWQFTVDAPDKAWAIQSKVPAAFAVTNIASRTPFFRPMHKRFVYSECR